jgi:hypothetical protein
MRTRIAACGLLAVMAAAGVSHAQGSGLAAAQRAAAFDAADADHDGVLTPDEFLNTPRGRAPNNPIVNWLATDKNQDGIVTRQEFIEPMIDEDSSAASPPKAPPPPPPPAPKGPPPGG